MNSARDNSKLGDFSGGLRNYNNNSSDRVVRVALLLLVVVDEDVRNGNGIASYKPWNKVEGRMDHWMIWSSWKRRSCCPVWNANNNNNLLLLLVVVVVIRKQQLSLHLPRVPKKLLLPLAIVLVPVPIDHLYPRG